MSQETQELAIRVGFFGTPAAADQAIRNLLSGGFSKFEIAVICPETFAGQLHNNVSVAEKPGSGAAQAVVSGGALGAALGGIGLLAVAATGGTGLLLALPVLVGGGAIAAGFSNLILTDGYDKGVGEYYDYAVHAQKIVVGVEVHGENQVLCLDEAKRILTASGAEPMHEDYSPVTRQETNAKV